MRLPPSVRKPLVAELIALRKAIENIIDAVSSQQEQRQLYLSERATMAQVRAYLLYDEGKADISKDGRSYSISINFKNFGLTPAYNTTHWINGEVTDSIDKPLAIVRKRRTKDTGAQTFGVAGQQSMCIRETFATDDLRDDRVIYVWGVIKYRDRSQRCQLDVFELRTDSKLSAGSSVPLIVSFNHASDYVDATMWNDCSKMGVFNEGWNNEADVSTQKLGVIEESRESNPKSIATIGRCQ